MDWLLNLLGITDLHFWTNPSWWAALAGIIWVDILLSGDNALVIGMVAAELPPRQRRYAVLLGTGAAILLRVACSLVMTQLLTLSWIGVVGAVVLAYIAVKLVLDHSESDLKPAASLGRAVTMIVLADITMSIDNMMAIAGLAHGDATLVGIGLLVSIALIIAGATLISSIIARYPWLTWVGAGFLGWIAGGIAESDPAVRAWTASQGWDISARNWVVDLGWPESYGPKVIHYGASAAGAVLVLLLAWVLSAVLRQREAHQLGIQEQVRRYAEASSAALDREDAERHDEIAGVVRKVLDELGWPGQGGLTAPPARQPGSAGPLIRPRPDIWAEHRLVPILPARFAETRRPAIIGSVVAAISRLPLGSSPTVRASIQVGGPVSVADFDPGQNDALGSGAMTTIDLVAEPWFSSGSAAVPECWYVREGSAASLEEMLAAEWNLAWPASEKDHVAA